MVGKIAKYLAYTAGVLGLLLYAFFLMGTVEPDRLFDWSMLLFWILFIAAVALMLTFMAKEFFSAGAIRGTIGGILGLALIIFIAYLISNTDSVGTQYAAETAKWVGTGLWTLYLLFITTLCVIVYTAVRKLLR